MLEENTFRYRFKITTWDEYVDLQFEEQQFSFDLNENGSPLFPKWVKRKTSIIHSRNDGKNDDPDEERKRVSR